MVRINNGHTAFRIKDLAGGINLENSPNEIDNKQCLKAENFNFTGNKLISAKSFEQSVVTTGGNVGGLTLNGEDVWHISEGNLYKNNTLQEENGGVFLSIKELDTYWTQFKPYITFWININGVDYNPTANYLLDTYYQDLITNLGEQLTTAGYTINSFAGGIFISKPSTTITVIIYKTVLFRTDYLGNKNDTSPDLYAYSINIDGQWFYASHGVSGTPTEGDRIKDIFNNLDNYITQYNANYSPEDLYLKRNGISGAYTYDLSDSTNYNSIGLIVNKITSYEFNYDLSRQYIIGENYSGSDFDSATLTINGTTYTTGAGSLLTILLNLKNQLDADGYRTKNYFTTSGYAWTNNSGYYLLIGSKDGNRFSSFNFDIFVSGVDYSIIRGPNYRGYYINNLGELFTSTGISPASAMNGLCDVIVGNLGTLVVDKDNGGASYFVDGMMIPIGEDKVGKPTIGTIYQGKIVLGGYEGNDNIVHSVTASITDPFNVFDFSSYNSGGGSVSGGNKSHLTGFYVGENGLYIFKDNEVWYTNSEKDDPSKSTYEFVFKKITSNGALSQSVITGVNQDVFYYDHINRKVRRLSYEQNLTTLRDTAISNEIDALFKVLPTDQKLATSHYKYPLYKLHLSDGTGGTVTYSSGKTYYKNNLCFVYNVDTKSWSTETVHTNVTLSVGNLIVKSDNKIYKDQISYINGGSFISKEYDFGDAIDVKRFSELEIYGLKESGVSLYVDIYQDGILSHTHTVVPNYPNGNFRNRFDFWTEGRFFKFGLRYEGAGNLEINEVNIMYKLLKNGFPTYN